MRLKINWSEEGKKTYNSNESYTIALSNSGAPHGPVAAGFTLCSTSLERSTFNASS